MNVPLPKFHFKTLSKKEIGDFKRSFELYLVANELQAKEEKLKVALLKLAFDPETNDLIDGINEEVTIKSIWKHLEEQLLPANNTCFEQYRFFNRKQEQDETFMKFYQELKSIAKFCEFGEQLDTIMKVRIVYGISNNQLRERLLRNPTLTLTEVVNHCRAAEEAREKVNLVAEKENSVMAINNSTQWYGNSSTRQHGNYQKQQHGNYQTRQHGNYQTQQHGNTSKQHYGNSRGNQQQQNNYARPRSQNFFNPQRKYNNFKQPNNGCSRCTSRHSRGQCPAYGKVCSICNGRNHLSRVCFKKEERKVQTMNYGTEDEDSDLEGNISTP
uniref:Uncharacterized protein n=1 Tax=Cacopsylla melanoneura TaxID=428564 RepID=A0A8D8ZH57_9HEMI